METMSPNASRRAVWLARLMGLALAGVLGSHAGLAKAACLITSSAANLDLGQAVSSSLAASEVNGYRKFGTRQLSLNGTCDQPQASVRLAFDGLQAVPGKALTRWGTEGALVFRIESASVDGVDVPLAVGQASAGGSLGSVGSGVYAFAVSLIEDAVVELDLTRLPADARKSFALQLSLTGLLPDGFVPRGQTRMDNHFTVRMIGAN